MLAGADPLHDHDPTLSFLASGARILAVEASIRAAALELWSVIDQPSREKFVQTPPSLADWTLDSERATLEGQPVRWGALAGITPLGWLVVLGTLTGALVGDWRGSLADPSLIGSQGFRILEPLIADLAVANDGDDDLPWGGLTGVTDAWSVSRTQRAFEALQQIDRAAGLLVTTHENSRFQIIAGSRRGPTEVQTSDGLRRLPGWAISWAKTINESRSGIERVAGVVGEEPAVFRWSETWREHRLVGIGVVQSAMAAFAGNAFAETNEPGDVLNAGSFIPAAEGLGIDRADTNNEPTSTISDVDRSSATTVRLDEPALLPSERKGPEDQHSD